MSVDEVDPAKLDARDLAGLVRDHRQEELRQLLEGPRRRSVLDSVFAGMPTVFRADRAAGMDAVIHWRVGDRPDGGRDTYELVISGGRCVLSDRPGREPGLVVTIGAVELLRMVTGNASPMALFMRGRLKAKGDLGLTAKLPQLFDIPKS
jgi:putative sterol carrier protein